MPWKTVNSLDTFQSRQRYLRTIQVRAAALGLLVFTTSFQLWSGALLVLQSQPIHTETDPLPMHVTALSTLFGLCGDQHQLAGLVLLGTALLAVWGMWRSLSFAWFGPQQILMLMAAGSAVLAIVVSQFADGTVRPRWFFLHDQAGLLWRAAAHSWAMLFINYRR